MQVNWFEPSELRCRPHSVLRVTGLKPLNNRRSPVTGGNCNALRSLDTQLKSKCEGRPSCVFDFGAIKAIRSSCRHIRYISIGVYCQPGTATITRHPKYACHTAELSIGRVIIHRVRKKRGLSFFYRAMHFSAKRDIEIASFA